MSLEDVKGAATSTVSWIVGNPAWAAVMLLLLVSAVAGWGTAISRARQVDDILEKSRKAEIKFKEKIAESDREWRGRYDELLVRTLASEKKLKDIRAKIAAAAAARPPFEPPATLEDARDRFGKAGFKGEIRK